MFGSRDPNSLYSTISGKTKPHFCGDKRKIIEHYGLLGYFDTIPPQKYLKIEDFELELGILLDQMDMLTVRTASLDLLKNVSVASSIVSLFMMVTMLN